MKDGKSKVLKSKVESRELPEVESLKVESRVSQCGGKCSQLWLERFCGAVCCPLSGLHGPSQLAIAGINITGVQGSVHGDGSGTAVGTLQLAGNPKVQLNRSASGEVTGTCGISFATAGVTVQGSFTLDTSGLKGKGSIHASPKDILDAAIVFDASGQATGTGHVSMGSAAIPASFSISAGSFDVSGSAPAKARADTPLASYEFPARCASAQTAGASQRPRRGR